MLKSKTKFRRDKMMLLTSDLLVQTKQILPLQRLIVSPEDGCSVFPYMSSDIRQKRESLKHLCCDYWKRDFSSPSSKDLHSIHSCSQRPDCFHIHAGNTVAFLSYCGRNEIYFKAGFEQKFLPIQPATNSWKDLFYHQHFSPKCSILLYTCAWLWSFSVQPSNPLSLHYVCGDL